MRCSIMTLDMNIPYTFNCLRLSPNKRGINTVHDGVPNCNIVNRTWNYYKVRCRSHDSHIHIPKRKRKVWYE